MPETVVVRRLKTPEASDHLLRTHGITLKPATLNKLRCVGGGPRFYLCGRAVLYAPFDLDEWASAKLGTSRSSTSERA